jgi:hypothetical protein
MHSPSMLVPEPEFQMYGLIIIGSEPRAKAQFSAGASEPISSVVMYVITLILQRFGLIEVCPSSYRAREILS